MKRGAIISTGSKVIIPHSPEERVRTVIERVRPYIQSHGGDVGVVGIKDGVLTLQIKGACAHCSLANQTYNKMVGTLISEETPEITKVILI